MARKRQPTSLNRSSLVSVVEFFARKLIIFVLLQLVLSPFILITADTLNGSLNNNGTFAPDLKRQFGCIANTSANPTANVVLGKCTGDGVLVGEPPLNETQQKNANGNSISTQSEVVANGTRSNDGLLPWIKGNATIHNQSRETITGIEFDQFQHQDDNFNMNGERVLSRKRRYLIFPPGSSLQIGKSQFHYGTPFVFYILIPSYILAFACVISFPFVHKKICCRSFNKCLLILIFWKKKSAHNTIFKMFLHSLRHIPSDC